ncbi:MAG: efflux RND transporter periplasmic adaptor subunit [Chitinophagaceae bacterium]|nr:efflux RND transporter periplasmic adaptor subunit [Chitinophagaceae bacterium]
MQTIIDIPKRLGRLISSTGNELIPILAVIAMLGFYACNSTSASTVPGQAPLPVLPVIEVAQSAATTYQEYSSSLQGTRDIEIRPQVEGNLDRIFVDEGAFVKKGQPLFLVNDRIYREQLNNANAALLVAQASFNNATTNVDKLTPLVQNNVISDVQLKTATIAKSGAAASVTQAQAIVENARINLGYTTIKAPADGYIGRIPFKTGSLVGTSVAQPLTVLSEIKKVYAYFSLSEKDFLEFENQFAGKTIEEKIKQIPAVELLLADNSLYPHKGHVEIVSGQFNNSMGAITLRTIFDNPNGLLRSGNTGRIRIPRLLNAALIIPQESTFELQDKTFVFVLSDSNTVKSIPVQLAGKSGNYYLVSKGINPGDRIVYSGLDRLKDGAKITPEKLSIDSVLKSNPLK